MGGAGWGWKVLPPPSSSPPQKGSFLIQRTPEAAWVILLHGWPLGKKGCLLRPKKAGGSLGTARLAFKEQRGGGFWDPNNCRRQPFMKNQNIEDNLTWGQRCRFFESLGMAWPGVEKCWGNYLGATHSSSPMRLARIFWAHSSTPMRLARISRDGGREKTVRNFY